MRNRRSHLIAAVKGCLAAILFMTVAASAVPSQQGQGPPPPDKRSPRAPDRSRELREKNLRSAEVGVDLERRDENRLDAVFKQMKEDFKRIQIVRNRMVRSLLADDPLDYKLIADETGEINERAGRLRTHLMPPAPEDKGKPEEKRIDFDDDDMKGALIQLCNRIAYFIDNPTVKNPGTIDVDQSARARSDLSIIIELTANIKRSAERLRSSRQ